MAQNADIYLNIQASEDEAKRIADAEAFWTARKLAALCAVTLGAALVLLYVLASWKSETSFPNFLLP